MLKIIGILCVEDDEIKIQKFSLVDYSWKKRRILVYYMFK